MRQCYIVFPNIFSHLLLCVPKLTVSWNFIALWTLICRDLRKCYLFFFFHKGCSFLFSEWRLLCITHSSVSLTRIITYVYHKKMLSITVIWFQDLLLQCCRVRKWHKTKGSFIWHIRESLSLPSSSLFASIQASLKFKTEELILRREIKKGQFSCRKKQGKNHRRHIQKVKIVYSTVHLSIIWPDTSGCVGFTAD